MSDLISRTWLLDVVENVIDWDTERDRNRIIHQVRELTPSAQPERLTDDDFETIRIHLSAYKERLCNQHRWKEAEEYQRIIDRFMSFASAQRKGTWIATKEWGGQNYSCSCCKFSFMVDTCMLEPMWNFCPNCGAEMKGEEDENNNQI